MVSEGRDWDINNLFFPSPFFQMQRLEKVLLKSIDFSTAQKNGEQKNYFPAFVS
jgi:hypothetical protein